ncbi:YtxH domain-containing protein [Candidatus Nitrospira bockiana]
MTSGAKVAALVAGGAVLGAGIGLLLAPQPGADTRRQIRHYAKRMQVEATRLGRSVRAGYERAVEQGKLFQEHKRPIEAA